VTGLAKTGHMWAHKIWLLFQTLMTLNLILLINCDHEFFHSHHGLYYTSYRIQIFTEKWLVKWQGVVLCLHTQFSQARSQILNTGLIFQYTLLHTPVDNISLHISSTWNIHHNMSRHLSLQTVGTWLKKKLGLYIVYDMSIQLYIIKSICHFTWIFFEASQPRWSGKNATYWLSLKSDTQKCSPETW